MSRKGHGGANAVAERFFPTRKTARISREDFHTPAPAQTAGWAYLDVFSNRQRGHAAAGYRAPLAYEQAWKTHGILCPEKC